MPAFLFRRAGSFAYGFTLPLQALRLIASRPPLIFWSLLPAALTVAIYGYVIHAVQTAGHQALAAYFARLGWSSEGLATWIALFLMKILLLLAGAVSFSFVATVVASPFNDFLAENTEKWTDPPLPPIASRGFANRIRLIGIDVGKTLAATFATITAILVSWVPVVNLAAFAAVWLLMTFQYISYPQTRRAQGVGEGLAFLWRHLFACAGFGCVLTFLFAIPFVASLTLPLAVVGGTLLVARAPGSPALPRLR